MPESTSSAADRRNYLLMPSQQVRPGQTFYMLWRRPTRGSVSLGGVAQELRDKLMESPNFFVVGNVVESGNAYGATIKVKNTPVAHTVDGIFADYRNVSVQTLAVVSITGRISLTLESVVPAQLGSGIENQTLPDAVGRAANDPSSRPDPLGLRSIGAGLAAGFGGVKTLLILGIIAYGLFTFGPALGTVAKRATK